jgi:hypothetical protein
VLVPVLELRMGSGSSIAIPSAPKKIFLKKQRVVVLQNEIEVGIGPTGVLDSFVM